MNGFGKYFITLSTFLAIVVFHSDNVIANDANYKVECVKNMLNTTIKNTELKSMSKAKQKKAVVETKKLSYPIKVGEMIPKENY